MPRIFIAGCGFVGLAAAHQFHSLGWDVVGGSRTGGIEGVPFPVVACDLSQKDTLASLGSFDAVIHCASSSRGGADAYRAVFLEGAHNLLEQFHPRHFFLTSSTSVYAQTDGTEVTEESPAIPDRETGQVLREAEDLILAQPGGCVVRLAGIYGPGRSVLLRRFFAAEAVIEGDGSRLINQIHRDDAASALVHLVRSGATGLFNAADNTPITQAEVYRWLAQHFDRPIPRHGPINTDRKRGVTHKAVSNAKLRSLGWSPKYPSFRDAVMHDRELLTHLLPNS